MKIAILTPHPIPFALGGAENLWWGLQSHIENETEHSCEIIALVSPENNLPNLVSSYEAFSKLDLSRFDRVISGKYPAWMANHPNHACYMLHRLRGLYDTYSGGVADPALTSHAPVAALLRFMAEARERGSIGEPETVAEFFERFRLLQQSPLPEGALVFPGPLAREIVHFLDDGALSPQKMTRHAAISRTVAERQGYFPHGAPVEVLYPPPHRDDYRCGSDDYFFTSSRLDGAKRIAFLIEAMAHVKHDIPLLIAGRGPDEERLRALAGDDPRIRFLGFVPDDEMPALYADALAVPFVPYDEDYGLITIEAMRSGKPVVTFTDSGGPCEFVREGVTGLSCAPDARALGAKLDYLCAHRDEARQMGENARRSVEGITWSAVYEGLFPSAPSSRRRVQRKPKLTVAATFPVYPPMGGGQARVFQLYKGLTSAFDIDLVTLSNSPERQGEREIAPGLVEIRVPKSSSHLLYEQELSTAVGDLPVGDITAHLLTGLTPDFSNALATSAIASKAVIACHPYLIGEINEVIGDRPLWYEAQDVEIELKTTFLSNTPAGERLLREVRAVEAQCWRSAHHVFACADRDIDTLHSLYGPTRAALHEVPNGVALDEIAFTLPARRRELKQIAGLGMRQCALFMGSWHGPNLEAVRDIIAAAALLPQIQFIVVGSAGLPFRDKPVPANVHLLGQVDAHIRDELLAVADVALNPMRSGSGTNLKMLDYFAAGIPVISTGFGARGLVIEKDVHFRQSAPDGLAEAVAAFAGLDRDEVDAMVMAARRVVEERYSWTVIADNFIASLKKAGFDPGTHTVPDKA